MQFHLARTSKMMLILRIEEEIDEPIASLTCTNKKKIECLHRAPDISMLSLRAHNHEILASHNAQAQAPDISSHIPDYQCTSSDRLSTSPVSSQVFPRLTTRLSNKFSDNNPFKCLMTLYPVFTHSPVSPNIQVHRHYHTRSLMFMVSTF